MTMGIKKALAIFIGILQSLIGALAIAFTYLLYYNPAFFEIRTLMKIPSEHIAFYMLLLSIIGFFSLISGLLIINEWSR